MSSPSISSQRIAYIARVAASLGCTPGAEMSARMLLYTRSKVGATKQSRKALEQACGWSSSRLSQVLNGRTPPTFGNLRMLAHGVEEIWGPVFVRGVLLGVLVARWDVLRHIADEELPRLEGLARGAPELLSGLPDVLALDLTGKAPPPPEMVENILTGEMEPKVTPETFVNGPGADQLRGY